MHITALCPFCRSAYQVQATLRGQLVRCPNASCRKTFPVPEAEPGADAPAAPKPPPSNGPRSGSVGDMVPILPAERATPSSESITTSKHVSEMRPVAPATPAPENQPADGNWWQTPPPVRSQGGTGNEKQTPAAPSSGQPAAAEAWWQNAPPVRHPQKPVKTGETPAPPASPPPTQRLRAPARPPAETHPMPALEPEKTDPLRELAPGAWEPPPVRRGQSEPEQAAQVVEEMEAEHSQEEPEDEGGSRRSKHRRAWRLIGIFTLGVAVLLGGGGIFVWQKILHSEEARAKEALADYQRPSYVNAQNGYVNLAKDFPASDNIKKYHFMAEWCGICNDVSNSESDLPAVAAQFDQFVEEHKKDELMKEFGRDAGRQLLHLAKTLADRNANPPDNKPLAAVDHIEKLRRTLIALHSDALTKDESRQIEVNLGQVRKAVELASKRRNVLAQVKMQGKESPMDALKRAHSLLARSERELPGIRAEAGPALAQLEEAHLASVVYHPAGDAPPPPPAALDDDGQTLPFAPLVRPAGLGNAPPKDPIVLALSRGVCYALKRTTGDLKWVTRVGIDTPVPPQRVPASAFTPELLLLLSADTQTLTALNVEGRSLWEYHVGQPVLGRPIIIDQRAYLADYSGWVHEIEISRGQLIGRWFLGQPLACGGAREVDANGETSRLYFPADDSCIYVLDVKSHRCATILYDGHPSGSLRSEPVLIAPEGETVPGYLILNQASGLDGMELRVFELPLQDRHAAPKTFDPPARLTGWTWFEPKQDGEKLAILSDAGTLGLFGIRQLGNDDPPLFPWLQAGGLNLSPFLQDRGEGRGARGEKRPLATRHSPLATKSERGRAQVVHMQGDDLWVLAHGRFQQVHLGMTPEKGPQAKPIWNEPPVLGSPLHQPQRLEDRNGLSTFFLVTQAHQQQTCLATAVDEWGHILWQRQLGLVCQGEPLALTPPGGGPPLLLALDQGGGLFGLDPSQPNKPHFLQNAPALAENPLLVPRLLLAADGRSAYEVAAPGDDPVLVLRHIEWVDGSRELHVTERKAPLPVSPRTKEALAPAGPPAVVGSQLLMAMADGNIRGVSVTAEEPTLRTGPSWRDPRIPVVAPCYVLALGGDRFLLTNGNRRLSVYEWPANANQIWQSLPMNGDVLKPLDYPVAAPPVLLPPAKGQPPRVVVADSAGMLHLFTVTPDGALQAGRTWKLPGNLSAGPFVQAVPGGGWRIGCVLDRRRLSWIDPAEADPLWKYDSGGPAILGPPQRIADMLVVALHSGRYVGIDPKTGKPRGRGYTLRASAAPAATPTAFGPGRMFAPLSDGTALLLSVDLLKTN